jgi:large subunit ribosomal protein L6
MSRIGKKIIEIPSGVKVEQKGKHVKVTGPLGNLEMDYHELIDVVLSDNSIEVQNPDPDNRLCKALHGTTRALIANLVTGVSKGYEKKMEIYGTGFNIKQQGQKLVLQVGFCHPVEMEIPKGLSVEIDIPATKGNDVPAKFAVKGIDRSELGQFAANIRGVRPPEPYKGKGIRYSDEYVRRKMGKAFASGGA